MDSLDKKIIQELIKDGRVPFQRIAENHGVSTQTITRRYEEMKKNGTIASFSIKLNLQKIGYCGAAHILIKIKPNVSSYQTVKELKKTSNIIVATRSIGTHEAYAILVFKTITDLYEDILRIKELPDVMTTDVSFGVPGFQVFPPELNQSKILDNTN
ncbi:MAG: Lrp/AsnC family transcriptional regulator [Candidatus Bathyarchaeota archaeon]|nr:Lrp/AsnC family transcriptional regulator [Candidatus Bathyarchaeota archaeon]